jgi:hypothetical protein
LLIVGPARARVDRVGGSRTETGATTAGTILENPTWDTPPMPQGDISDDAFLDILMEEEARIMDSYSPKMIQAPTE